MKTPLKWLVVGIFAFQAIGASWFMHLASCGVPSPRPSGQPRDACVAGCPSGHLLRNVREAGWPRSGFPSDPLTRPAKTDPCRHEGQTCPVCQMFLTLAATMPIPPALPAINPPTHEEPIPSPLPAAEVFLGPSQARGPPAGLL